MSQNKNFDVIVVGAGPAGAMAAQYAAKGGLRVALLERKEKAGIPIRCGEGTGHEGISKSVDLEECWIQTTINTVRMISSSGYKVDLNIIGKDKSYIINREIMDNDLVQRAVQAGAFYFPGTPVISIKSPGSKQYICFSPKEEFHASCLILADGVESKCARDLGWNTALSMEDIESCAFCRVEHNSIVDDIIEFYIGSKIAPIGYVWVFPRGKGKANVGLGILGTKSKAGLANELLKNFIDKKFPNASVSDLHCGSVPVGKWLKPLVKNGVMIVGDAARQVNCLTGGGIGYALYAGKTAGETVAEAYNNMEIKYSYLKRYQKRWASYCGKQQMRSYALKSLLIKQENDEFYDNVARSLIHEDPDNLNYMRIFFRIFAKHPLMLLKIFFLFR